MVERVPLLYICVFRPLTEHGCWQIRELAAREFRHRHIDLLLEALAESEQVRECVASQWFRFGYNRTVTPEDRCSMDQLVETFAASGYDIKELLVGLTQTNAFLYRRAVTEAETEMGGAQ